MDAGDVDRRRHLLAVSLVWGSVPVCVASGVWIALQWQPAAPPDWRVPLPAGLVGARQLHTLSVVALLCGLALLVPSLRRIRRVGALAAAATLLLGLGWTARSLGWRRLAINRIAAPLEVKGVWYAAFSGDVLWVASADGVATHYRLDVVLHTMVLPVGLLAALSAMIRGLPGPRLRAVPSRLVTMLRAAGRHLAATGDPATSGRVDRPANGGGVDGDPLPPLPLHPDDVARWSAR